MMHSALGKLLFLRFRGGARYQIRQFATLRGAIFLLCAAAIGWLIVGGGAPEAGHHGTAMALDHGAMLRGHIADLMPLALFAACLFTVFAASGPALHFSQHEIDFLFTGPFARRDLVIYKLCAYFAGAVLSAAIFAVLIQGRASTGTAAFVGSLLTLVFMQLSTAAFSTLVLAYAQSPVMRWRKPAAVVIAAAVAAAVLYLSVGSDRSVFEALITFRNSWPGSVVLAPFAVFAQLFLAERVFPDLIVWTGCALAINGVLLFVIVRLDGRANDHALAASLRLSNRWARMRQGASFWASEKTTGRSLRRAPAIGGFGPIAWRQAINAMRNSGRVIAMFFVIAMLSGPLMAGIGSPSSMSGFAGLAYFFLAFIVPRSLVCDFRGEIATIELYKSLPASPWRICAAQLVVPVVLSSAIQLTMIASAVIFVGGPQAGVLMVLAAYAVPSSLLLYGLENLLFLLFPTRLVPVGRADFEFLGRTLIDFAAKTIVIVAAAVAAAAAGYAAMGAGQSWTWFVAASWLVVSFAALSTVPLLALAFRRFRISQTIPA